ncbi:hypothetical protein SAMN04487905_10770 [Actinopolyspora xinjiangensis]|uniref:DUF3558 domain-containing protein n=1 Tax=Actinopolyspora xinjiangensis TaxID=405564 RepID=A0A1H0UPN9_9ACTN|nr:DUF3558 domain-containing protein [Actinopolyspora xinjiangensis]SDP68212.1 hypothetical protein SAMN04487905_10770 [Actinopolyspora xinjiangensis]
MPARHRSPWSVLPLLLVLLAGCAVLPGADTSRHRGERGVPSDVLGELATLDPCELLDPRRLDRFGEVARAATVSLDYCLFHVRPESGGLLQLAVGRLHDVDAAKLTASNPVHHVGGIRLVRQPPVPDHCTWRMLFSDGLAMNVDVDLLSGDPEVGLCAVAERGARGSAESVLAGEIEHRRFPPDSLTTVDPCALLSDGVVRRIDGLERARRRAAPAGHRCTWGGETIRVPSVEVVLTAGEPPSRRDATSVVERIAGRRTVVDIVGDDPKVGLCSAETAHIPFGGSDGGEVEVAMLVVFLPDADGVRACEFARGLAERAWPELPRR